VDKAEAVRRFVREHTLFLGSASATTETVRKLRIEFAHRASLKSAERFSNIDVAKEFAGLLLRSKRPTRDSFLLQLGTVPFIREVAGVLEPGLLFDVSTQPENPVLLPEDLSKLATTDYRREVEDKLRGELEKETREDLKGQIEEVDRLKEGLEKERAELARFRSDLDSIPDDSSIEDLANTLLPEAAGPPEIPPEAWWTEVGLRGDPFPSNMGLIGFNPQDYDGIVVKTPFFTRYLQQATSTPKALLEKTTLVLGEFGSGKTTLFQYLAADVSRVGLLPINVVLSPHPSVESLTTRMLEQIADGLAAAYAARFGRDPRATHNARDSYALSAELFTDLQRETHSIGLLVLVDGLHKGTSYQAQVLEFLQQIQNVQEYFQYRAVPMGLLVAGSPLWEREFERVPSLSGSYYRKDSIPPLAEDAAVDAVERRIQFFARDPATPPKIDSEGLRLAYRVLAQRIPRPLTFRDYLDHVRTRLEAREFAELGVSVALHVETVEGVRSFLKTSPLAREFDRLWAELPGHPTLRKAARRTLLEILASKHGLSESGKFFQRHRGAFKLLQRNRLISRQRTAESFGWTFSQELRDTLADAVKHLHNSARDILRAALDEPEQVRAAETALIYGGTVERLRHDAQSWRDSWPELAGFMEEARSKLESLDQSLAQKHLRSVQQDDVRVPIQLIIEGINSACYPDPVSGSERWTLFRESFICPENVEQISRFDGPDFSMPSNETAISAVLQEHARVVSQLVDLLEDLVKGESIIRLSSRNLTLDELGKLHLARSRFLKTAYEEALVIGLDILEERIRQNVFVALRATWADGAYARLPPDVQEAIGRLPDRGHPRARRAADANFLYDVNRSDYRKILEEANIRRAVFGPLLGDRERQRFFDTIALAFSLGDRVAHRDRPEYFRAHSTEIGSVLRELPSMLEIFHGVCERFVNPTRSELTRQSDEGLSVCFSDGTAVQPAAATIRVAGKEALDLGWLILEHSSPRPWAIDSLLTPCISGNSAPEVHIAVVRGLLKSGQISLSRGRLSPLNLFVTPKGVAAYAARSHKRRAHD
jgi:hypothetical protein